MMHKRFTLIAGLAAGCLLLTLAPGRARADDPTAVEFVAGSWAGFGESSLLPAVQFPAFLAIQGTQRHRGFFGDAMLPAVQMGDGSVRFLCDGSVSQADVMNVRGVSADGTLMLSMHGKTRAMGDGSVRVAALQYQIMDLNGALVDQGYLLFLQRLGGLDWMAAGPPNVTGTWGGTWDSRAGAGRGRLVGDFFSMLLNRDGAPTSAFRGSLGFLADDGALIGLLRIQGTVGTPSITDGTSNTLMVGITSRGIIAVLIGLLQPAPAANGLPAVQLQGGYMLFDNLADVFAAIWRGSDTSFDHGMYELVPAV